jgi:hypothetical protein
VLREKSKNCDSDRDRAELCAALRKKSANCDCDSDCDCDWAEPCAALRKINMKCDCDCDRVQAQEKRELRLRLRQDRALRSTAQEKFELRR